jgi:hypothetical protein
MELEGPAESSQGRVTASLAGCLQMDCVNVDQALTRIGTRKTRRFASGSKPLIYLEDLVAGTGFEPVTFRL